MGAFAAFGTTPTQLTYAQHNWGIPSTGVGLADPKGIWAVAKVAASATMVTALAAVTMPAPAKPLPASAQPLRAWDFGAGTMAPGGLISDASRVLGRTMHLPHNSEAMDKIKELLFARPATDVGAIAQIHALAAQSFATPTGGAPQIDYRVEDEPDGPALFLTVDTHGMDFDEQMRRELAMRDAIWADARLQAAKNYVVISVY